MRSAKPRASKRRARAASADAESALSVTAASARVHALLRARDQLVKQIAGKQRALAEATEAFQNMVTSLQARMPELIERQRRVAADLEQLIRELLANPKLPKKARRVLDYLTASFDLNVEPEVDVDDGEPAAWGDHQHHRDPAGTGAFRPAEGGGKSAEHAGGQAGKTSVRDIFRRLAVALHPDRARHEEERAARTEVMKDVTRAYEEGDLARLLQIESQWLNGDAVPTRATDTEARIAALEATIKELRAQLKQVRREIQELRENDPVRHPSGFGVRVPRGHDPVEYLIATANEELAEAERARDFVRDFRDQKITLKEFVAGPPRAVADYPADAMDLDDESLRLALERMIAGMDFEPSPAPRRSSKRRKGGRSGPIPF